MKLATILFCLWTAACQSPGTQPVTQLIAAAREGNTARISELVKSGVDVNERGGVNNWTPLMHAVHKNQPASVGALLDAGADIDATAGARNRDTALRLAEGEGYTGIAKSLRDHGAKASR
jgi:ankyrin repeat protein